MQLAPGTRLGPYEILSAIGEGGMGAVYRAHDSRLGRDVAIKVLRGDVMADGDRRARFAQEAKAASALKHSSIITVYDIGTEGDVVYMVMELVDGRPLDQVVRSDGFNPADVLRIGSQIADACAAAHARQIIHRDLKPANVMLQPDGHIKVLDFGLAKFVETDDAGKDATQTAAGMILGTAAYMSPEQAQGKPLDARTDIFSLGSMLYELSTGRRPFQGSSNASVLAEVLKEDPPSPDELRSDLPPGLAHLIMRCLRKDPERRVQSMADLRAALDELRDEVASGKTTTVRTTPSMTIAAVHVPPTPATRSRALITAVGIIATMIAVAAYSIWRATLNPALVDNTPLQALPLTTYAGTERAGGFSPDGTQVAFAWDGESGDNIDIYIKLIGAGNPVRLTTDPAQDSIPRWSPDGKQIAFARLTKRDEMSLIVIPSLGGTERKVAQFHPYVAIAPLYDIAWTPDSQYLFVAAGLKPGDKSNLHRVNLATGEIKTLITVDASSDGYLGLDVSPDRRRLATVHDRLGSQEVEIYDLSADWEISNPKSMKDLAANALEARWTPDSRDLLFTVSVNNPLPMYRLSPDTGKSVPLLWVGPGAGTPVVSAAANRLVFTRDIRDTNIWRVALGAASNARPVMDKIAVSSFREVAPAYSPDGKRLAFHSNRSGSVQIWVANADGSNPVQLTSMDPMATTGTARWSPDSQRLVFDSNASFDATTKGGYHLYTMSADGGQPKPLTTGATRNYSAWWGPDNWIYFTSDRTGQLSVWKIQPDGTGAQPVTTTGADAAQVSPDGQWLYFTKQEGTGGLWRMPIGGGAETRLVDSVYRYNYSVTAKGVYSIGLPTQFAGFSLRFQTVDRRSVIHFFDFATGKTTDVAPIDNRVDLGLAVSPDGKYLLFTKIDYFGGDLMVVEKFR